MPCVKTFSAEWRSAVVECADATGDRSKSLIDTGNEEKDWRSLSLNDRVQQPWYIWDMIGHVYLLH